MADPFKELIDTLKTHNGTALPSEIETSVKHWIRFPEAIDFLRKKMWFLTDAGKEVLDIAELYISPHENPTIQNLSEQYRKEFVI